MASQKFVATLTRMQIIEAFYRGEPLFLEQEQWLQVLQGCISSRPAAQDRSEVAITLFQTLTPMLGLLADAKAFVQNDDAQDDQQRRALLRRARQLRARLLQWRQRWKNRLLLSREESGPRDCNSPAGHGKDGYMLVLLCSYDAFFIACNRLCVALDASDEVALEQETLAMARKMTARQDLGGPAVAWADAPAVCENPTQAPTIIRCLATASMALNTAQEWHTAMRLRKSVAGGEKGVFIDGSVLLSYLKRIGFGVEGQTPA